MLAQKIGVVGTTSLSLGPMWDLYILCQNPKSVLYIIDFQLFILHNLK